jgi:hypothetical protein
MAYVSNFKKFIKTEEKKTTETGANPSIEEQVTSTESTTDTPDTNAAQTETPAAPASVEADPAVAAARQSVAQAIANRDKTVMAKQAELDKLKTDQNNLVNTANTNLNKALQDAAKKQTTQA